MKKTLEEKVAKIIADILDYYDDSYDIKEDVQYIIQIVSQAIREEDLRELSQFGTLMHGLRNDNKTSIVFGLEEFREYYYTKIGGMK